MGKSEGPRSDKTPGEMREEHRRRVLTALSNQSPKELVSVSGKRIFAGRDKRARMAPKINFAFERDKSRARNAANSGHFATIGEISVRARLCGGAGNMERFDYCYPRWCTTLRCLGRIGFVQTQTLPLNLHFARGPKRTSSPRGQVTPSKTSA